MKKVFVLEIPGMRGSYKKYLACNNTLEALLLAKKYVQETRSTCFLYDPVYQKWYMKRWVGVRISAHTDEEIGYHRVWEEMP